MFVLISRYLKDASEKEKHYAAHREWLAPLYADGTILGSGPQNPPVGGLIIMKAPSRDAVEQLLIHDPFVIHGIATYTITEFSPNPLPFRSPDLESFLSEPS